MNSSPVKVKRHSFSRRKYNREFLMDCVHFSVGKREVTIGEPFCFDFHGLFLLKSGEVQITIEDITYSLTKRAIIFLRANQVREYLAVSPDFSGYLLIFENEFIETFFSDPLFIHRFQFFQTDLPPSLSIHQDSISEYSQICEKIRLELACLKNDSHHFVRSLLYNILIQINRAYIDKYQLSSALYQDDISLRFRKLLEDHIKTHQRVEDYAGLLKVSRSSLNAALKRTAGKSASLIIRDRLMTELKRELAYSEKSISEIAYDMGFSDSSNFVRFFKANSGITPGQFRTERSK